MEEKNEKIIEIISRIAEIPEEDREVHLSVCICGGTLKAWRSEADNGHLRAVCDKCGFKLVE